MGPSLSSWSTASERLETPSLRKPAADGLDLPTGDEARRVSKNDPAGAREVPACAGTLEDDQAVRDAAHEGYRAPRRGNGLKVPFGLRAAATTSRLRPTVGATVLGRHKLDLSFGQFAALLLSTRFGR
jgi:hypothetical protein